MSKIQSTQSAIIDLLEAVKESLMTNRMSEAYRTISQGKMSMKARETLRGLAELISRKEHELQKASQLNRFYRSSIQRVVDQQEIGTFIQKQFINIHEGCKDLLTDLQDLVKSIKQSIVQKEEQCRTLSQRLVEQQQRVIIHKREKEQSVQVVQFQRQMAQNRIIKLKNETEIVKRQLEQRLASKQQQLEASNIRIIQQKHIKQSFQKRLHETQAQLQKIIQFNASTSDESERLSQILKEQNELLRKQSKKLQENLQSIKAQSLISQPSVILSVNDKHELPLALSSVIKKQVGKEVKSVQKLYSYKQQRKQNFHKNIDNKNNILLVCLTKRDQIVGAFTTACFDLSQYSLQKPTKAFLFGMHNEEISVNLLKNNRESIAYDWDFLIFGNEQICIEKGKKTLTSLRAQASDSVLHFQPSNKQDYFLDVVSQGRVQLKNYEIFELQFEQ